MRKGWNDGETERRKERKSNRPRNISSRLRVGKA